MKKIKSCILLVLFCFVGLFVIGQQNLINNGSFENKSSKPLTRSLDGQIDQLTQCGTGWRSFTALTPDYFHTTVSDICGKNNGYSDKYIAASTSQASQPNLWGEEIPSDGDAYSGIIINMTNDGIAVQNSEYVFTKLITPLVNGREYILSFKVSLAEASNVTLNNIGALITDSNIFSGLNPPIQGRQILTGYSPQAKAVNIISQSNGWVTVSGTFTATGSENCVIVGYFPDVSNNLKNTIQTPPTYCYNVTNWVYYYIDEVKLTSECLCEENIEIRYTSVAAGDIPSPHPDSCYYKLDITSTLGGCGVYGIKIYDFNTGEVLFNGNTNNPIYGGSGYHANTVINSNNGVLALPKSTGPRKITTVLFDLNGNPYCPRETTIEGCNVACCPKLIFNLKKDSLIWNEEATEYYAMYCWDVDINNIGSCKIKSVDITGGFGLRHIDFINPIAPGNTLLGAIKDLCKTTQCIDSNFLTFIFYNESGSIVCMREDTLLTPGKDACCRGNFNELPTSLTLEAVKISEDNGICCYQLYLKNPYFGDLYLRYGLHLTIGGALSFEKGQWITQTYSPPSGGMVFKFKKSFDPKLNVIKKGEKIFLGTICTNDAFPRIFPIVLDKDYPLGQGQGAAGCGGNGVLTSQDFLKCSNYPLNTCCSKLNATLIQSEPQDNSCFCKFDIMAGILPGSGCNITSIQLIAGGDASVTPISISNPPDLSQGLKIGTLCVPITTPTAGTGWNTFTASVTIKFIDANGNICSKTLEQQCTVYINGGGGGSGNKNDPHETLSIPDNSNNKKENGLYCLPNPFTRVTKINYVIPANGNIELGIYTVQGQLVEIIEKGDKKAGVYELIYNNGKLAPDIYILKLHNGQKVEQLKLVISPE